MSGPGAVTCVMASIAPGGGPIGAVSAACGRAPATRTLVAGTRVPREWLAAQSRLERTRGASGEQAGGAGGAGAAGMASTRCERRAGRRRGASAAERSG
jgi:hypothetical protein